MGYRELLLQFWTGKITMQWGSDIMYSRLLGKHERNPGYALLMTDWAVGRHNIVAHAIAEIGRAHV